MITPYLRWRWHLIFFCRPCPPLFGSSMLAATQGLNYYGSGSWDIVPRFLDACVSWAATSYDPLTRLAAVASALGGGTAPVGTARLLSAQLPVGKVQKIGELPAL